LNTTQKKPRIAAVIPFYNEQRTLPELFNRTLPYADIIIAVNDGSTDDFLKNIKINERIVIISNKKNEGKGYSINRGLKKSIELNSDITITLDADLQHPPELIPSLVKTLDNYDFVIGNRLNDLKGMPFHRILSNKITSLMMGVKLRQHIPDSQCGFRAYRTGILHNILPDSKGYEAESEILVRAKRKGLKIGFAQIPTIYLKRKSKMRSMKTIAGFLRILFS
jgi:glycosyltransferase involved in cell wall biosynthesis